MSQWVRLWEDMPTDPKWRVVARRAGRPMAEVLAVFVFMMTNAGGAAERGTLENWSDEDVAAALDMEPEHVEAIRLAMQGKTLDGDHLTGWERRQPRREGDNSTARVRAFREKGNAVKRDETHGNAREEENREDTENTPNDQQQPSLPREPAAAAGLDRGEVEERCREFVPGLNGFSVVEGWLRDGLDMDRAFALMREITADLTKRGEPPRSFVAFDRAVRDRTRQPKPKFKPVAQVFVPVDSEDWRALCRTSKESFWRSQIRKQGDIEGVLVPEERLRNLGALQ